jgi:hypothetical protein
MTLSGGLRRFGNGCSVLGLRALGAGWRESRVKMLDISNVAMMLV